MDIVTFGDHRMMVASLNAVAALTNNSSFSSIALSGMLVGLIFIVSKYLTTLRLDLQHLLTAFVLYNVMFVPKVSVNVESPSYGNVTPVDNVPVGIAFPLSVSTTVGRYFTEQFETVFSVTSQVSLLENGYMDALTTLLKVRDFKVQNTDANTNASFTQDVHKTILSYLSDCVLFDMRSDSPTITLATINNTPLSTSLWDTLKTTYINIDTRTYMNNTTTPQYASCDAVWTDLNTNFFANNAKLELATNSILAPLGRIKLYQQSGQERLQDAFSAIGVTANYSNNYVINSLLMTSFVEADIMNSSNSGAIAATVMKTQATSQNNTRWAAEQSQFERYAKPIISFIEIFVIATAPIMAFVITAFGVSGISLAFKYLMMIIWVAFWHPTLALTNYFVHFKIVDYLTFLDETRTNVTGLEEALKVANLPEFWLQIQDWIAVGGMMAAATPALTLMLLYGTSQTATHLAGRLNQGERVDEKQLSPDMMANGALVNKTPEVQGRASTLMFQSAPSASFSLQDMQAQVGHIAQSQLNSGTQTLGQTYGVLNSQTAMAQRGEQLAHTVQKSNVKSLQDTMTDTYNKSVGILRSLGYSEDESAMAAKTAIGTLGAGTGSLSPVQIGLSSSKNHTDQQRISASKQASEQINKLLSHAHSKIKSNTQSSAVIDAFSKTQGHLNQRAQIETNQMTEAHQKIDNASKLASYSQSASRSSSADVKSTPQDFANHLLRDNSPENINALNKINDHANSRMQDPQFNSSYKTNLAFFDKNNVGASDEQKQLAARIKTMAFSNNDQDKAAFYTALADSQGIKPSNIESDYKKNAEAVKNSPSPNPQVEQEFQGNKFGDIKAKVTDGKEPSVDKPTSPDSNINPNPTQNTTPKGSKNSSPKGPKNTSKKSIPSSSDQPSGSSTSSPYAPSPKSPSSTQSPEQGQMNFRVGDQMVSMPNTPEAQQMAKDFNQTANNQKNAINNGTVGGANASLSPTMRLLQNGVQTDQEAGDYFEKTFGDKYGPAYGKAARAAYEHSSAFVGPAGVTFFLFKQGGKLFAKEAVKGAVKNAIKTESSLATKSAIAAGTSSMTSNFIQGGGSIPKKIGDNYLPKNTPYSKNPYVDVPD